MMVVMPRESGARIGAGSAAAPPPASRKRHRRPAATSLD